MLSIDWLQFSVRMNEAEPELMCPDGYRLDIVQGNNIFRYRALLFDRLGRKTLTLLWSPYSSRISKFIMTVQVSNECLYNDTIPYVMEILNEIVECEFNSMGRIDLCCDWEVNDNDLDTIWKLDNHVYYCQGKAEGSNWWHAGKREGVSTIFPHCLSWGKPSSEIKVKIYNKSREQNVDTFSRMKKEAKKRVPPPEKPYIVDAWRDLGMNIEKIWRCEFSMKGAGQLRWNEKSITLEDLSNGNWWADVFMNLKNNRLVIRKDTGGRNGHHNEDPIIDFLPMPREGVKLEWYKGSGKDNAPSEVITLVRKLLVQLESPLSKSNKNVCISMCNAIMDIVTNCHIEWYFTKVMGLNVDDYLANIIDDSGTGLGYTVLEPSRAWT